MSEPSSRPKRFHPAPLLYRLSMYSGFRALWNRARAVGRPRTSVAAALHGTVLGIPALGAVKLSVHARPRPKDEAQSKHFAMISARQLRPNTHNLVYRYGLVTTHFGCGHLEMSFFEQDGRLTFYGARNMGLANVLRLGLQGPAWGDAETCVVDFARACQSLLAEHGVSVALASPTECARLSFRQDLIAPDQRQRVQRHITARYRRLHKQLATTVYSPESTSPSL